MRPAKIIDVISEVLDIPVEVIMGRESKREYVDARYIFYTLCVENGMKPKQLIFHISSFPDQIYYGLKQAKILLQTDKKFKEKYNLVKFKIKEIQNATE